MLVVSQKSILGCLFILSLSISPVYAKFIVKYKDGTVAKTEIDPREMMAMTSSDGNEIEYIEEDVILKRHATTSNDPLFSQQWALSNYLNYSFMRAKSYESTVINVAVVDTGITAHSDLNSVVLQGADFISDTTNSRDGGGRDADPSDPGDYADGTCGESSSSSWHGTHIAGIIGAVSGNGYGIAGASSSVRIIPARVLGPCGGQTSDIADAIRWAVGGSVSGVAVNQNPARVVNLSLGGKSSCSQYMQEAIDYANSRGAVVVVSAGNESASVDSMEYTPANCRGVFRVGAITSSLYESSYSNYGEIVDISAPGDIIYSTVNGGFTYPSASGSFRTMSGTSMSAGFISAAIASVFSANSNLTGEQAKDIIVRNASYVNCRNYNCTQGAVDVYAAVQDAVSEVRDTSFTYDDPVVVNGYQSSSSYLTRSGSSGGGGLCGTIDMQDEDKGQTKRTILFLALLFVTINFSTRLRNFFKITASN
ncbi:S8 family peptidase [Bacteriovorax sp. Seq25_V]|uniref:S8 family peptidase n=1 Tax=Bacteriovorax sp. Seq25_V TaxID=1201288 RepID=UPI00038A3609|nr:S8 family peptidase [Bacteriovorax sp. Seq25_V]EQC47754.1 serine metalloprotease MprA family protein [Bacteriovorax sp. Seq25_V]